MRHRSPVPAQVLAAAACLAAATGSACSGGDAPARAIGDGTAIVATLHPLAAVARTVAGPGARIRTILPPGAHPDTYEATPRDAEALAAADLVVRVGGAADAWVDAPRDVPVVAFIDGMPLKAAGDDHGHDATGNPHVWLDPILVRDEFLPRLTEALARVSPDSATAIRDRASAYADSLTALDGEIRSLLARAPTRRFIAAHPAWVYFADRYDLEPAGVIHASPGREVGTRALAGLVDRARELGVRAVIAEPQLGRAGVEALARELDARIEVADPVGGQNVEGRGDYLSLMRFNARAFGRALGIDPAGTAAPDADADADAGGDAP